MALDFSSFGTRVDATDDVMDFASFGVPVEDEKQKPLPEGVKPSEGRSATPMGKPDPRLVTGDAPERTVSGTVVDAGITLLKGAIGLPEAIVGLADIPARGRIGKFLEEQGYKPREAKQILDGYLSEAQKEANRKVEKAEGFTETVKAAVQNPSTIAASVGESLPQMLGGAGIARGILSAAPKVAPLIAGAMGEGLISAGSAAEQIRGETENGLLTTGQAASAVGSGVGTAVLGMAGGRVAQKLGFDDIETMLASGSKAGAAKSVPAFAAKVAGAGISEGAFEEMPQSAQERMWQNYATDKPLMDGVAEDAAMGLVTGAAMGGATSASGGINRTAPVAPATPATPAVTNFTPPGSPTQEAGLPDLVVPVPVQQPAEGPDLSETERTYMLDTLRNNTRPAASAGMDTATALPPLGAGVDAAVPGTSTEQPADTTKPAATWFGRRGDGYVTVKDAEQALPGRRRMQPDLEWKIEQLPSGKFQLAGYQQEQTNGTQATQAIEAAQEGSQAQRGTERQVNAGVRAYEWGEQDAAPVGAWVKDDYTVDGKRNVWQVRDIPIQDLYLPELTEDGRLQPEKRKYLDGYVERAKSGEVPPPIKVIEMENGRLRVIDGHRRTVAAREAGKSVVRAIVSPLVETESGKVPANEDLIFGPQAPAVGAEAPVTSGQAPVTDEGSGYAKPVTLQNRDRTSAASIAQMNEIAANPDYMRVGPSREMQSGSPVVFGDVPANAVLGRTETVVDGKGDRVQTRYAVVEADTLLASNRADGTTVAEYAEGVPGMLRAVAGNGRTAGLQAAYERGSAQQYRTELQADAQAIGIDPQTIAGMRAPVLVRVMDAADVKPDMGDRTNITGTQQLNAVEQAATDVARIDLAGLEFDGRGDPTSKSVLGFVYSMPVSERSALLEADGRPNRFATDRLMAATFKQAYDSDELVNLYAQAADVDAKAVINAVASAAAPMAQLKGAGQYDVRSLVTEAAKMAVNASRKGVKMSDYIITVDLDANPEAMEVAKFMADNIRSGKRMGEGLRALASLAAEQHTIEQDNATNGGGMFGETPTLSRQQVLETLNGKPSTATVGVPQIGAVAGTGAQSTDVGPAPVTQGAEAGIPAVAEVPAGYEVKANPTGTLTVTGNVTEARAKLKAAGITKLAPSKGGFIVGKDQAEAARAVLGGGEVVQSAQQAAPAVEDVGIEIRPGKGQIKGKFLANVDGFTVPGSPFDTEAEAYAASEKFAVTHRAAVASREKRTAETQALRSRIAEKLRSGESVTNVDISNLGMSAGESDMSRFMSNAAELFGLNSRDIRPIVKDMIRVSFTDMGAKREFVPTRQALEAIARKVNLNKATEALTSPTRQDILAQQERTEKAAAMDEREQVRRESEAGAGMFQLQAEDGRQDDTGLLFSRRGDDVEVGFKSGTRFLQAQSSAGVVGGTVRDGVLRITHAEVDEDRRGTGEGVRLYSALIDKALSDGLGVTSDSTVEADAVRVYEALKRRGYSVDRLDGGTTEDGAVYGRGAVDPAFAITASPENADIRRSFAGQSATTADRPTIGAPVTKIRQALEKAYGRSMVTQLERKGVVSLVQSIEDAVTEAAKARVEKMGGDMEAIRQSMLRSVRRSVADTIQADDAGMGDIDIRRSKDGDVQGFYDPATGKSFLVADSLTTKTAPSVLMHEVGIHAASDGSLQPIFDRAEELLKEFAEHPFVKAINERIKASGETSSEEKAAYMVEGYELGRTNLPPSIGQWVRDFMAAVRAWLYSKGVIIKASDLDVSDLAAIARANVRKMARDGVRSGIQFDHDLAKLFDRLRSATGDDLTQAQEDARNHPLSEKITMVERDFYDILGRLDDAGLITIKC